MKIKYTVLLCRKVSSISGWVYLCKKIALKGYKGYSKFKVRFSKHWELKYLSSKQIGNIYHFSCFRVYEIIFIQLQEQQETKVETQSKDW